MNEQFCRVLFKLSRIDVDIEMTEKKGEVIYHSNQNIQAFLNTMRKALTFLKIKFKQ